LGAIVLLALALRLWGIEDGLPHPLARPDEERITDKALRMLSDHTLTPASSSIRSARDRDWRAEDRGCASDAL
jgi:hypothetical protein